MSGCELALATALASVTVLTSAAMAVLARLAQLLRWAQCFLEAAQGWSAPERSFQ